MLSHRVLITVISAVAVVSGGLGIAWFLQPQTAYCQIFYNQQQQQQPPEEKNCYYHTPIENYFDGILQLYQHKPGGAVWYLEDPHHQPHLGLCIYNSDCEVKAIGGGWYTDEGPQNNIRNEVPADPSYQRPGNHQGTFDQSVWRRAGYMESPHDWRNMEVSALFYLPPGTDKDPGSYGPAGIDYVLRGSVNSNGNMLECLAQNYHVGYFPTGADAGGKVERDIEHTNGYNAGQITGDKLTSQPIPLMGTGKVFGFKVVIYNDHTNTKVRIDAYLDKTGSGSNWQLIYSFIDPGNGQPDIDSVRGQTHCPGLDPTKAVTFGGPFSGLRLNWSHAFFRQLIFREIIPPYF